MKKRLREIARLVSPLGWKVAGLTPGGHIRLRHESGAVYHTASTPSCARGERNALMHLRRVARRAEAAAEAAA